MNIALFGGSFDPPHIGHEEIIKKALDKLDIDLLFVVPTFLNPFKDSSTAPASLRSKWLEKMLRFYPQVKILKYELEQNRAVPTIETIKYILDNYDISKIYLIIGADNFHSLHRWKNYKELQNLVEFVIASRDDIKIPKSLKKLDICVNISSTKLRDKIIKDYIPESISNEVVEYYTKESNEPKNR